MAPPAKPPPPRGCPPSRGPEKSPPPGAASGVRAPGQVRGLTAVDARADVYALGCILFQILSRQMLHPSGKAGLVTAISGLDARPSVRAPDRVIPPELDELCVQATLTDREQRLATARELGDRVQRFLDGDRDLALRRQLAADHLAKAQAAFASSDRDDQRRLAMREAASAIALDPALTAAAELVGRLMPEPPRDTPTEVGQAPLEDDVTAMQGNARIGVWAYVVFFAFMPFVWWIAPRGSPYVLAVSVLVLVNMGLCYVGSRVRPLGLEGILAITNAILLAVAARMFTPFLVAPGLAAMSAMAIVFTPTRSWVR